MEDAYGRHSINNSRSIGIMGGFLLACSIIKLIGFIVKLLIFISELKEPDHDGFQFCRYGMVCFPFDVMTLVGLIMGTVYLW
jgi:hypothetical protein